MSVTCKKGEEAKLPVWKIMREWRLKRKHSCHCVGSQEGLASGNVLTVQMDAETSRAMVARWK